MRQYGLEPNNYECGKEDHIVKYYVWPRILEIYCEKIGILASALNITLETLKSLLGQT